MLDCSNPTSANDPAYKRDQISTTSINTKMLQDVAKKNLSISKLNPIQSNMLQQVDQTCATSCVQQCCDMLRRNVIILIMIESST